MPQPNRGRKIVQRYDDTNESISLARIVSRAHFQNHLVFLTQVERLSDLAPAQVPNMHPVAVLGFHEQIRLQTILNHLRGRPFRAEEGVMEQVPPVIVQVLVTPVDFPLPKHVKSEVVEQKISPGPSPEGDPSALT